MLKEAYILAFFANFCYADKADREKGGVHMLHVNKQMTTCCAYCPPLSAEFG